MIICIWMILSHPYTDNPKENMRVKEKAFWQRSLPCSWYLYVVHDNSSSSSLQMPAEWGWTDVVASAPSGTERHLGKLTLFVYNVRGNTCEEKQELRPTPHLIPQLVRAAKTPKGANDTGKDGWFYYYNADVLLGEDVFACRFQACVFSCSVQSKQLYLTAEEEESIKRKTQLIHSQWYFSVWTIDHCAEYNGTSLLKWIVCW